MTHDPFAPPADTTPPTPLPPVHYTYGPPPDVVPGPRPPAGLAVAVIVMSWIWVGWFVVLGFAADASEEVWRGAVAQGLRYTDVGLVPFDLAYQPVRPFIVATFVVVSLWLHQSRRFAQAHVREHRFRVSIAWTWFGWLVPVVSLWFPVRVVKDLWRMTLRRRLAWYAVPWWGCWLLMLGMGWGAEDWLGGFSRRGALEDTAMSVGESYIACAVLGLFSCWAWTAIVLRIRRGQLALAAGPAGLPDERDANQG